MKKRAVLIGFLAVAALITSFYKMSQARQNVSISTIQIGALPATLFRLAEPNKFQPSQRQGLQPVVVIAHGFAGSQQLMQPLALTLARNGFVALTFDFSGHGRNAQPMPGGLVNLQRSTDALIEDISQVVAYARTLPGTDPAVGLVGHSMASELVVQFAQTQNPGPIKAVTAISLFGQSVTATSPPNLLVIDGALEFQMLVDGGLRIMSDAAHGPAQPLTTYGDFSAGTARRLVLARGAEHIGVIYSEDALHETLQWMDAAFQNPAPATSAFLDQRGGWIGLMFLSLVVLAWPLSHTLRVVSPTLLGAGLPWQRLLLVGLAPAILTPLILWKLPTRFLPILLGDYLVIHFALYGVLTFAMLRFVNRHAAAVGPQASPNKRALLFDVAAMALFTIVGLGWPIDHFVTSFVPTGERWWIIPIMLLGTASYFLADEWITRGTGAARGGSIFTKVCFLISLIVAIALNPQKLFFLVIIIPVICVLFVVYGLFSRWVLARTGDPRVAALGNAMGLAVAISVTFPIVG